MALPITFTLVKFPLTKLPATAIQNTQYPKIYSDFFALFNTVRAMWGYLDQNFQALEDSIGGFVPEAPEDGTIYGRQNGEWVPVGGGGSVDWGDIGGTITDQTDLAAALASKEPTITAGTTAQYWRGDKSWQTLPSPGIGEAPNDGQQYARQSLGWSVVTGGGGGGGTLPWSTFVAPPTSGWSWSNQGSASITSSATAQALTGTATAVSNTCFRSRLRNLPTSSNYAVIAAIQPSIILANYYGPGLILYDTATTQNVTFAIRASAGFFVIDIAANSNPNTFAGTYLNGPAVNSDIVWLKIVDDGTNRICYYATNGLDWIQLHSVARTNFITPDAIGFGLHCDDRSSTGFVPYARLWSWQETTP